MRPRLLAVALVLLLPGCNPGDNVTLPEGFCFGFCGFGDGSTEPARYHTVPVILPNDMRVGDTVRVDVQFVDPASTGYVTWRSLDPSVAAWDEPSPPCPRDRCRVLRAVGRGTTQVDRSVFCSERPSDGCGSTMTLIRVADAPLRPT